MKPTRTRRLMHRRHKQHRVLRLELLRERVVLDGAGLGAADPLPWFDPGALTYSFAPDQTPVAGEQSRLFDQMAGLGDASVWKTQFDNAFNAWLSPLGVSTNEVPDSGSRFGVPGRTQGDARFGDVRIAAVPLSNGVLATSVPHSAMVQGTWAGDILINSNATWNNVQEVFAVAMHEFGHVLGMEHSTDPASPMFIHGVHDALAPTIADLDALRALYIGIQFEESHSDEGSDDPPGSPEPESGEPEGAPIGYPFDILSARPLTATVGTSIRYSARGALSDGVDLVYRLDPPVQEADGLENLAIAFQSAGAGRLAPEIEVFDQQGQMLTTEVLHYGQGNVVIQATGVENDQLHFIRIRSTVDAPASTQASTQAGDFEMIMDFVPELRQSRKIGKINLNEGSPIAEQGFSVGSSRLVHLHIDSEVSSAVDSVVYAEMLDDADQRIARLAIPLGQSRSAPLVFVPAGDYKLRFYASQSSEGIVESQLDIYLDEVSIDVGPGVIDPTGEPLTQCDGSNPDPALCGGYIPIVTVPPVYPNPETLPTGPEFPWWSGYGFSCDDYSLPNPDVSNLDPMWWEFYLAACQPEPVDPPLTGPPIVPPPAVVPPEVNPPVVNPPVVNPPVVNPPVVNPPDVNPAPTSPWQNPNDLADVSGDLNVTARDALIIINLLGSIGLDSITVSGSTSHMFADVNGDFLVTAQDALVVINELARRQAISEIGVAVGLLDPPTNSASNADQQVAIDEAVTSLF